MSIYPKPIINGMKFHRDTKYMICIRKPEDGGGQVAVLQPSLENDPDWIPWEPEEFRDNPGQNELSHANLSNEEIIGLVKDRLGIDISDLAAPDEIASGEPTTSEPEYAGLPTKAELPEKLNETQLNMTKKADLVKILTDVGIDADDTITKKDLAKMYNALYD